MHFEPEVHWEEGMFLRPQHLQALTRSAREALGGGIRQAGPYRYGIGRLTIDTERIRLFEFAVREAQITFADGTIVALPGNAEIESRDFRQEFALSGGTLAVYLGLRDRVPGVSIAATGSETKARYRIVDDEVVDENTGQDSEPIRRRVLCPRLLFETDDRSGYQVVKIAELVRGSEVDPAPVLAEGFVPPLLHVHADRGARQRLQGLLDTLRHADDRLGEAVRKRPVSFAVEQGADPEGLLKLAATNEVLASLEPVCSHAGVHPFDAYRALCAAIGRLAVFGEKRSLPQLPRYDHENLGPILARLATEIGDLLGHVFVQSFERRSFAAATADGSLLTCSLDKGWLDNGRELFLGIEGELGNLDDLDTAVTTRLKLAGRSDVAVLRASVQPGILLRRASPPPLSLPSMRKLAYYRLLPEESQSTRIKALRESMEAALFCTGGAIPPHRYHLYATRPAGVAAS